MRRVLGRTPIAVALGLLAVIAGAVGVAPATPPGDNGQITFRRYLGPDRTMGAIYTIAPDGSGERQLTTPPETFSDDFPDYASDGSFVAFERCGEATCRIYTVRADGSGIKQVGPGCKGDAVPPACSDNFYPAISPNRKRIAFAHAFGEIRNDQIDHVGIYTMRADGSHVRRVTLPPKRKAEDGEPQWSPNGKRLVFVRFNITAKPKGKQAIFTVRGDGSGLRRITPWKLMAGDGPDWAPDGSRILFRSPDTEDFLNSNYYTVRPDGSGLTQITDVPDGTKLYSASFSPDGGSITFGSTGVDAMADVFTMRADGSGAAPVTRSSQWDSAPDWGGAP